MSQVENELEVKLKKYQDELITKKITLPKWHKSKGDTFYNIGSILLELERLDESILNYQEAMNMYVTIQISI